VARSRGLVIYPPKLSVGAYFELSFLVPKHRNQWQEVEGLLFNPQNSQLVHIWSFHF
jgi:hypothetical protein